MLTVDVSGRGRLEIKNIVLDVNGTICIDGHLIDELSVLTQLIKEAYQIDFYLVTAATRGVPQKEADELGATVEVVAGDEALAKKEFISRLGSSITAAIGNGSNDALMLKEAAVGIAVIQKEAAAVEAVLAADVLVTDVRDALGLFLHPRRLKATLRK